MLSNINACDVVQLLVYKEYIPSFRLWTNGCWLPVLRRPKCSWRRLNHRLCNYFSLLCQFYNMRVFWLDSLLLGRFSQVPIHQQFETVLINHLWRLWQLNNKYNKVDSNILSVQESSQPFSIKKKKTSLKTFKRQRENFLALAYQTPVVKSLLKLRNKAALLVT